MVPILKKQRTQSTSLDDDLDFQEWKQCQACITTFDKMILEIRKYGFSFITLLLTAKGFLLGLGSTDKLPTNGVILATYFAILVLIIALFRIDRVHAIFLRAAVLRAMEIEEKKEMKLTRTIAYWSEVGKTATWGMALYGLLASAAFGLALAGFYTQECFPTLWALAAGVFLLGGLWFFWWYHNKTRMKIESKNPLKETDPFYCYINRYSRNLSTHGK